MSANRRLARLEAALPPREAVLLWLADVHEHGSLDTYVAAMLEQPGTRSPFVTIPERARAAARSAHPGATRATIREAERRATADAVFLLQLVLEMEHAATEAIGTGSRLLTALTWESRARTAEGGADRQAWAAWRAGVIDLATDVARSEAMRRILEDSHFDGREVLFPVTLAAWAELQEGVAALVAESRSRPGPRRRRPDREVAREAERTAPQAAGILVEGVRARTLDLLGDHMGALGVVGQGSRRAVGR